MKPFEKEQRLLPEYGSTPHLPHKPNTSRGDTIASEEDASIIFSSPHVVVEEKVDGAAVAMLLDTEGHVILRNRNHILRKGYSARTTAKKQYAPLWNYAYHHIERLDGLNTIMQEPVGIYGEWLVMEHGSHYKKDLVKKDPFFAYAIYLPSYGRFLDPKSARNHLEEYGFQVPPELAPHVCAYEQLEVLANEKSELADDDLREGVYVKVGDGKFLTHRFKMVRQGFEPGKYFTRRK